MQRWKHLGLMFFLFFPFAGYAINPCLSPNFNLLEPSENHLKNAKFIDNNLPQDWALVLGNENNVSLEKNVQT